MKTYRGSPGRNAVVLPFWLGLILAVVVPLGCSGDSDEALSRCIQHEALATHLHVTLVPVLDHQPQPLPARIGISADCTRPLHTHAPDFIIHVEYPEKRTFTLGDFFLVWGEENPYKGLQTTSVSVDGQPYQGDYRDMALKDGQRIVVEFTSRQS